MAGPNQIDGERLATFRLTLVDGLGPGRIRNLVARFGSAQQVWAAGSNELASVDGIGPKLAAAIQSATNDDEVVAMIERMHRLGIRLLFESDDEYPPNLQEIYDNPMALNIRGDLLPSDKAAVAIVGSRRCTDYGLKTAVQLAGQLASRGVTVVSGLARGVDAAAHRGALAAGGRTIAVLASGLANIYPPEHVELAEEIVRQGALLSEAPLDGAPRGGLFPQRNRIISGISIGIVVVEAAARSGALSTARHALDQNREVFAVPGRIGDAASEGTNRLIKQGAAVATGVEDILEALGPIEVNPTPDEPVTAKQDRVRPAGMDDVQQKLWDALALATDALELETLLEQTGLRASEASAALLMLEMRKHVRRLPGNRYVLV